MGRRVSRSKAGTHHQGRPPPPPGSSSRSPPEERAVRGPWPLSGTGEREATTSLQCCGFMKAAGARRALAADPRVALCEQRPGALAQPDPTLPRWVTATASGVQQGWLGLPARGAPGGEKLGQEVVSAQGKGFAQPGSAQRTKKQSAVEGSSRSTKGGVLMVQCAGRALKFRLAGTETNGLKASPETEGP